MNEKEKNSIVIIGAGLVGSLLGCYLSKKSFKIDIYEGREDIRIKQLSAGKSINLAISERGIHALKEIGIFEEIKPIIIPMKGRMIHSLEGKKNFQPYSKDQSQSIFSVSRSELNRKLMTLAEKNSQVKIHFNYKCLEMNVKTGDITFLNEKTKEVIIKYGSTHQIVLGCDGAYSAIRTSMMKTIFFDYSQKYLQYGYKELHIPGENGEFKLEKNCLHIWPRNTFMMIALPNIDGSFTVTCFFPMDNKEIGFNYLDNTNDENVMNFFKTYFSDVIPLMPTLLHDFRNNPTGSMVTIKCFPWSINSTCCLFGDAAHAIVPFFGQGMNAGFEDCSIFNQCLNEFDGNNWEKIFRNYQILRKENTDAIAKMALENFDEMKKKVADAEFEFKKKVEHLLGNKFPGRFNSRYELVSFTRIPYKKVLEIGKINDKITSELINNINHNNIENDDDNLQKIDLNKAKELIDKNFPNKFL